MSRRRERVKLNGFTNKERPINTERLPLHECPYSYTSHKLGVPRHVRQVTPNPITSQLDYYKSRSKSSRYRSSLPNPLPNTASSAMGLPHQMERPSTQVSSERKSSVLRSQRSKQEVHREADQETQLVHIEPSITTEGQINIDKIKEIQLLIKRRYKNRRDFRKIFNIWDSDNSGALRAEDLHSMINRFGVPLNLIEAKALLASANPSRSGALSLEEFIQLIFQDPGEMKLDLHKSETDLVSKYESEVNQNTHKVQNELKILLKKQSNTIRPAFKRADRNKSGCVSFETFCNVLSNLAIPFTIHSQKHFRLLFDTCGGNETGISYNEFMDSLKHMKEEDCLRLEEMKSSLQEERTRPQAKTAVPSSRKLRSEVLDRQALPPNKLDSVYMKSRPIRKYIQAKYSEEEIREQLGERITMQALSTFVKESLKENTKYAGNIDAFLSCFIYNKDSETAVDDLVHFLYTDETTAANNMYVKRRSMPPLEHREVLKEVELNRLLFDIEQKMVTEGTKHSYKLFKAFDVDCDGYLSSADVKKALVKHSISISDAEITAFMGYLDKKNQGFVSYTDFAKVMGIPAMTRNGSQPSRQSYEDLKDKIQDANEKYEEIQAGYRANELVINLRPKTRFGATPQDQSRRVVYASPGTSCYLAENSRFVSKRHSPVTFAKEDKEKAALAQMSRIHYIQRTQSEFKDMLDRHEEKIVNREQLKIVSTNAAKEEYFNRVSNN